MNFKIFHDFSKMGRLFIDLLIYYPAVFSLACGICSFGLITTSFSDLSIVDYDPFLASFHGDYSPAPGPTPSPSPHPLPSCEELKGVGSLNTTCELSYSLNFTDNLHIKGSGNVFILEGVNLNCPYLGCSIVINITGEFRLHERAEIIAGSLSVVAGNVTFFSGTVINATGLGGVPPVTTGTPLDGNGGGGGYGGRGASCSMDGEKHPEDVWGGNAYGWESLHEPWFYGSKGGSTDKEVDYGGKGGGKIRFEVKDVIDAQGILLADGGDCGIKGGGGSGGSIYISAKKMTGSVRMSASGGNGFAGGGGGRVSVDAISRLDVSSFSIHGGRSLGCPTNSGAAGTYFDAFPKRLIINNENMSTDSDTILLAFPNQPLWTNVYIQNHARATLPMLWSRIQVQGQLSLTCGAVLTFGLARYVLSEFELIAEELLMRDSVIKIYGAFRMSVKIHLMLNSEMLIDGDVNTIVGTSSIEASSLLVLKESSVIRSNANLGVHGQGSLNLTGSGDLIEAQRLVLSLFNCISVGPGSLLRGPLENASSSFMVSKLYCEQESCPIELLHPPEDCNVNASLSFTLQICRVEDVIVEGFMEGSIVHFHWVRTVVVKPSGVISASGLGCIGGLGKGEILPNSHFSGAGHGGRGGDTYVNGNYIRGGDTYGDADLPCELGSGSGNYSMPGTAAGGGIVVMGSLEHSLLYLSIDGSLQANGASSTKFIREQDGGYISDTVAGGGSGGSILLFVRNLSLGDSSVISAAGGFGSTDGGGGGGGRVHFHWTDITTGDEYLPLAREQGTLCVRGGAGQGYGRDGENGSVSGKECPKGLYGIFCQECPVGTYKNVSGSDRGLCHECPSNELPCRAIYLAVQGGVTDTPCPYTCMSERYHLPHCLTALEELIHAFGGPWLFGLITLSLLLVVAFVLSVARMKFISTDELPAHTRAHRRGSSIDRSFPFLESLNEVLERNRADASHTHVHRMYFMGCNTYSEPWHLLHSPPKELTEIVYEDAFNRFVDEINSLAPYNWWEGSLYNIFSIFAYPLAWSWQQFCQKKKIQHLCEFVRSEYNHACLRSCRSRALYEGLKVAATADLMLAYVDFFLGGDETRNDLPPRLQKRFPMSIVFGGDGSYMAPFSLQSDNILTSLMSQLVPPTIWYRLVAGLNAQLRLVRRGHLRSTFHPVISWLETHANPTLKAHGVHVYLTCFQPSASGYCQFGLVVCAIEDEAVKLTIERPTLRLAKQTRLPVTRWRKALDRVNEHAAIQKRIPGEILNANNLHTLREKMIISFPFYFIIRNIKPIGHGDLVGLVISVLLLADFILVLLTLLQLYSSSLLDFFLVLSILPLAIVLPVPAGFIALFSHGSQRSAGLMRVYALLNITSVINIVVSLLCGFFHFETQPSLSKKHSIQSWNLITDETGWWMLPCGLILCKLFQARMINYHVANLDIQDHTLYSEDRDDFWRSRNSIRNRSKTICFPFLILSSSS